MMDVVALGELLIDFTPGGASSDGNDLFERNPGGAPANVLASLSRLGGSGGFIGKVGEDQFGYFLKDVLDQNGINSDGLVFSEEANTTLAFVHLDENGERNFSFYRKPGADIMLGEDEVDLALIDGANIFHFGSLSMTHEPSKTATLKAVEYAKRSGKLISYDPNWRPPLWESDRAAKEGMTTGLSYADILKISEEELEFLTGESNLQKGTRILEDMGIKMILVTLGSEGCFYRYFKGTGKVKGFNVNAVDTTGAGDAFLGGFLYHISRLKIPLEDLSKDRLEDVIRFSNAVGAICVTKKGAIPAMPCMEDVMEFLSR
ncbi:MAG TPA: PfkB family carbohydrate kinase [Clostridia bacterium]|nr:PfkB family carbohydrate kinase [Clostridia bacterium]